MTFTSTAEAVRVESDERGFELHIETDTDGLLIINVHGIAEELYDTVKAAIGPWLQERDDALASYRPPVPGRMLGPIGYELGDPKHPTFRERMADTADMLRKRAKEAGSGD